MKITRNSILDYQNYTMELPITASQLADGCSLRDGGEPLQEAFPTLDLEQRYFLSTGITPDEWKKNFSGNADTGEEN